MYRFLSELAQIVNTYIYKVDLYIDIYLTNTVYISYKFLC